MAQPSAIDPFQEALKDMAKGRKGSPAIASSSTPPTMGTPPPITQSKIGAGLKKKKSVTWAAEGELEKVKWIEKAVYDDDGPANVRILLLLPPSHVSNAVPDDCHTWIYVLIVNVPLMFAFLGLLRGV